MHREPYVHIGLMQAAPEVMVNLHGPWECSAGSGFGTHRITDVYLKFHQLSGIPALERYTVKLAEFLSTESIGRWLPTVKKVGVEGNVSVMDAGKLWSIYGKTWDARTRWVVAGEYNSTDEADEACREWGKVLDTIAGVDRDLFWPQVESAGLSTGEEPTGAVEVRIGDELCRGSVFRLEPLGKKSYFSIFNITVGKEFHWEHSKTLRYAGNLMLLGDRYGGITVVNELPIETYLESVASSEASSGAPDEYLKAQAVAARSTMLATVSRHHRIDPFDLCAEDHCQCYYGMDQVDKRISRVVKSTSGLVRIIDRRPADCRYAKICGGKTENYPSVWGGESVPYLVSRSCGGGRTKETSSVEELLELTYSSLCNPRLHKYPTTLEHTRNLFRWQEERKASDIESRVDEVLQTSIGRVRELRPLTRGASGRITRLQLVGSEREITVRGELMIRRLLSDSHLPSSMFIVQPEGKGPDHFLLRGGGWGHGVGMCQLGGMSLAKAGSSFDRILDAYYPGTITEKLW
ncbi:hypothetical protein AMJ86_08345 [bacterium SM23_57]|nr:MAG: hypothetical protein AMJ86_08345 [bacterium SM23_57]